MLMRLENAVRVQNKSDRRQTLLDYGLAGGKLAFDAGEVKDIAPSVFRRHWRKSWLFRFEPDEAAEPKAEVEGEDLLLLKTQELRDLAKLHGLTFKVGTPKSEIIAAMEAAKEGN